MSGPAPRVEFLDAVTSDLVFVARGKTREKVFQAAAEALLAATLENPSSVESRIEHEVVLSEPDEELLLLAFLNELVFLRDARGWLLRVGSLELETVGGKACLHARLVGEPGDPDRHRFASEVKAATAHGLALRQVAEGWEATVTVDV